MPTPPDVAVALLGVGLAVAGAALVGSVGARMSAGQPPLRLWTEGPAGTMRAVLPCALESGVTSTALICTLLKSALAPFAQTRRLARWLSAVLAVIVLQRGAFALDLARYHWAAISGHTLGLGVSYVSFMLCAGEAAPAARKLNVGAAAVIVSSMLVNLGAVLVGSPLFRTGM